MSSIELNQSIAATSNASWRDLIGIVASIGCAIHCAAMPLVIAYLPAWGLSFLADEAFHKWMALICFLIAIAAFLPGLRVHGRWLPIGIGAAGLVLITFAAFGLAGECCPTCESASNAIGSEISGGESGCESQAKCEHCEHCGNETIHERMAKEVVSIEANDDSVSRSDALLSSLAPWLTPLGGMLLVSAHLLNRRLGGLCGCCDPDECDPAD